jgi:PAP2 superfamily
MKRNLLTLVGLGILTLPGIAPAQNAVTDWNDIAVKTAVAGNSVIPPNSPNGIALYLAYVHLAIHDAVNAIEHRYKPYGPAIEAPIGASVEAAVAAAAYTTLDFHFPDQSATLTAQYNWALATLPDTGKADGIAAGIAAANQLIALRANDGHGANVPYTYPSAPTPGVWIPTPPAFAPPITPWMGQMVPFTMRSASQFLPEPPFSLSSTEWVDDYNQVKAVGAINSVVRTPRQTEIALFWTENTSVQYSRALRNLAGAYALDLADTARLFALVWTSSADALIGCWNAKYQYSFWRPVTAIRNGDIDGNPATVPDPTWTPLVNTPAHPEYPSAHGCFTGAVADSLKQYFGTPRFTFIVSSTVTNTVHEIHSTRELEQEVKEARVYAGIHFHHSVVQGADLGRKVARQAFREFFEVESRK